MNIDLFLPLLRDIPIASNLRDRRNPRDHCEDEKMKVKKGSGLAKVIKKIVEAGL